jgi:hypothetical protein
MRYVMLGEVTFSSTRRSFCVLGPVGEVEDAQDAEAGLAQLHAPGAEETAQRCVLRGVSAVDAQANFHRQRVGRGVFVGVAPRYDLAILRVELRCHRPDFFHCASRYGLAVTSVNFGA